MTAVVPGIVRQDARPPIKMEVAPASGAAAVDPPTLHQRPWIEPWLGPDTGEGHLPTDAAVRRYWTAIVGPAAVVDLLRLIVAAKAGQIVRRPINLPALLAEELVEMRGESVMVPARIPYLRERQIRRLSPKLRLEYRKLLEELEEPHEAEE